MAAESSSSEPDDDDQELTLTERNGSELPQRDGLLAGDDDEGNDEEEEGEEEDDEEPRLKYATITKSLSSIYRNGDATSIFLVGGDKLIVGTHNGNIHVISLPGFKSIRVYRAHSASVSSISISPFPPPFSAPKSDSVIRTVSNAPSSQAKPPSDISSSPSSRGSARQPHVPAIPSNQIYIATSSIDGNICVSSLVNPDDVQLRNFGRPINTVALSPLYKSDRNYLSGGTAGSLILTNGGQVGKSTNANVGGAVAVASGWLGAVGIGGNTGTDKVLHSGEGAISTIKWSLSGKYVLWVNEYGIKIMRSNLHLESVDQNFEWKRMRHIDRPQSPGWEEMASVWKARVEWVNRENLEDEEDLALTPAQRKVSNGNTQHGSVKTSSQTKKEEAIIGWGGTVWIVQVHPGSTGTGENVGERSIGRVEVVTRLRTDCIISGVSLYTPNLLLVLAYLESNDETNEKNTKDTSGKKGRKHRQNALEPELRLISIGSQEEVSTDMLTMSRYQSLSASDYHLGTLPPVNISPIASQKSALEAIGSGLWDASTYPARMFGSGASIKSESHLEEKSSSKAASGTVARTTHLKEQQDFPTIQGMKIFIFSPYDCTLAIRRDLTDRLNWLMQTERYQKAWDLLDQHPEAVGTSQEASGTSSPQAPSATGSVGAGLPRANTSLADFFADSASTSSMSTTKKFHSAAEKEKRRIGELWLQQMVSVKSWKVAGDVAGKVLQTTSRWEYWIWVFIRNNKYDEISSHIPTFQITPPLPSLIYEITLGHYISSDVNRFTALVDQWPSDLFDIGSITTAVEDKLKLKEIKEGSRTWRTLTEYLAKLFLAGGRHEDALRCYIRIQDAETAMSLIQDHHLLDAVAEDIPSLILLRVSKDQLKSAPVDELEAASSDAIKMLAEEAHHGNVHPDSVVTQLESSNLLLFLFFYLKCLWRGDGTAASTESKIGRPSARTLVQDEGKGIVEEFADLAVELFADYDRALLMEFLQASTVYNFDAAVQVCERRHYTSELIYLLSKTGQMKKALLLIINDLRDVSHAIKFAKEQDDPDLWDDLLEYSMSRPKFIEGLLTEVGTAIDPIKLVKRIPSGLEIEGLRDGLKKMIREYDLQDSISAGVAKVLHNEVAEIMARLRQGQKKGIKFDVDVSEDSARHNAPPSKEGEGEKKSGETSGLTSTGHCAECKEAFSKNESETLVGFACGHVYHLPHLLHSSAPASPLDADTGTLDEDDLPLTFSRSIGQKVTHARLLKDQIEAAGGCRVCSALNHKGEGEGEDSALPRR